MRQKVIVIGGGIAGLTAGWKLAERGFDVTLYEAETETGGQARAFMVDGHSVEHGSHAFFGYYETVLKLIDELRQDPALAGDMPGLETIPGWTLVDAYGRRALLMQKPGWPKLLSVVPSILKVPWFSFWDKLRTLWAALQLVLTPLKRYPELDQLTSYEYGRKIGYSEIGILTWNSASLGLTNMFVQEQSAAILAGKHRVLIGTANGLSYQLPAGNLTKLYGWPARRKIEAHGGRVVTLARATEIARPDGAARSRVVFDVAGQRVEDEADHVIVAMQPWDARALCPWAEAAWTTLVPVTPVITIVLGLSGKLGSSSDAREYGLSREHWAFSVVTDLSQFWPEYAGDKTVLRAEVGHADLLPGGVNMPEPLLIELVKRDLDRLFPDAASLKVEWTRIHRETKQLYVRWTRGQFSKKPEQRDIGRGVFLAGDWTTLGTIGMEAAANSGIEAANHVLGKNGRDLIPYRDVPLS
jgi:protoporphyrinogen oxidase